jgi:hypothetical protein
MLNDILVMIATIALALGLTFGKAKAEDSTMFLCSNEPSMELVAEALVKSQESADEVVMPMLQSGVCRFLDHEIEVHITHRDKVFGDEPHQVQVVAFVVDEENGLGVELFGLMPMEPSI